MLPEQFLGRMEKLLGTEYGQFLESYDRQRRGALRVNLQKGSVQELVERTNFLSDPVPWAPGGYFYREDARPGKHPYHEAGAYYIQEASAMAPAFYLKARPGERVLDLCAAPGGKSTQIAEHMQGKGLLVCNEIHPQRAKILSENIERMGIGNAIVVNHEPAFLAERFPGYFDRILVDAPCSGEGMFRKREGASGEWSPDNVKMCAKRQQDILESAAVMLRPGGRLVYSTCTFAPEENEGTISSFLEGHPGFYLEKEEKYPGMASGIAPFCGAATKGIEKTIRLWPHKLEGEGHFLACLKREGDMQGTVSIYGEEKGFEGKECREWEEFCRQYLKVSFSGIFLKFKDQLYLAPEGTPSLKGVKVLRPGLHLGTVKKNRFEPAHSLALYLHPQEAAYSLDLTSGEAWDYIKGQTFPAKGGKGWYLITVDGYSLGWGKLAGGIMKNHYPKGLRK